MDLHPLTQGTPPFETQAMRVAQAQVPQVSPFWVRLFGAYARRYMRRAFHAVRLSRAGKPPQSPNLPLVLYCNHPSWWDPLLGLILAQTLFAERTHYAPMEASALARYRFFSRLGFFGVASGTMQGAMTFLNVGQAILAQPQTALWITPEGRFTDPRGRPVRLQSGLGYLARNLTDGMFLPIAIEYPFWEERFPEALVRFATPIRVASHPDFSASEWTHLLATQLEATQDALAHDACERDPEAFDVLLRGRVGIGGVYDLWRSWRARLRGERFDKSHGGDDL
jgi:1-acyl-sn-glycerol-3-phosphate acyltransferase